MPRNEQSLPLPGSWPYSFTAAAGWPRAEYASARRTAARMHESTAAVELNGFSHVAVSQVGAPRARLDVLLLERGEAVQLRPRGRSLVVV